MTIPLTGDGKFRDEVVRIAELTVNRSTIEDLEFSNCRIIGPAVLALLENVNMAGCRWEAPDMNALFWVVPENRPVVVGAVAVRNATFSNCSFENIGLAGSPSFRAIVEKGFGST